MLVNGQLMVIEEAIRYIDRLHEMLDSRIRHQPHSHQGIFFVAVYNCLSVCFFVSVCLFLCLFSVLCISFCRFCCVCRLSVSVRSKPRSFQ